MYISYEEEKLINNNYLLILTIQLFGIQPTPSIISNTVNTYNCNEFHYIISSSVV